MHIVVVTGLSGSGKSTAIKAFEDIGYFCIDNLPVPMLPSLLDLLERDMSEIRRIALGIDIRERRFLNEYERIFSDLETAGYRFEIIFIEASNEILQRRYSQTRRVHPAAMSEPLLIDAINSEREQLHALRNRAARIIDTANLSVHQLKAIVTRTFSIVDENRRLSVQVLSFGFKYGLPFEADIVMDVRFLPNPYFQEGLRELDGCTDAVRDWLLQWPEANAFIYDFTGLLLRLLPSYVKEGKRYLTIATGCTGGKHRSVVTANQIAEKLRNNNYFVTVFHRDIHLE